MGRVAINDLAKLLAQKNGIWQKDAKLFVNSFFEAIQACIERDGQVKVKGLGTFKVIDIEARESVDVNSGERLVIKSHQKISFTPDAAMKELVNKPFSCFDTVELDDGVVFDDFNDSSAVVDDNKSTTTPNEGPAEEAEDVEVGSDDAEDNDGPAPVLDSFLTSDDSQKASEANIANDEPQKAEPVVEPNREEIVDNNTPTEAIETDTVAAIVNEEDNSPNVQEEDGPTDVPDEDAPTDVPDEDEPTDIPDEDELTDIQDEDEPTDVREEETLFYDDDEEERTRSKRRKRLYWCLAFIIFSIVSFGVGYLIGNRISPYEALVNLFASEDTVTATIIESDALAEEAVDTVAAVPTTDSVALSHPAEATIEEPASTQPAPADAQPAEESWKKYEAMDARVRTGAYHIVGTSEVIKARKGDTVGRIARRMLGDISMSCYIEVYNGMRVDSLLAEGQEVKIPKLEVKKKKKMIKN